MAARSRCQTPEKVRANIMTMKEKLKIHAEIEHEMQESVSCYLYWESLTPEEVISMIHEKDAAMEWDEQFRFLCDLLESKERKEKTA